MLVAAGNSVLQDLLQDRDQEDERLAEEERDLAIRLAKASGCRAYRQDEESNSEEDGYGSADDDDGGCRDFEEVDEDEPGARRRGAGGTCNSPAKLKCYRVRYLPSSRRSYPRSISKHLKR